MKRNSNIFHSVNRKEIIVETVQCKKQVLKIIVRDRTLYRHRKKIAVLTVIAILNIYCYYSQILNLVLCALIQLLVLCFTYRIFFKVQRQTLLVVKSLGIQLESQSLLRRSSTFIPWSNLKDVVINEVLSMRVIYILIIITKTPVGSTKGKRIIPLFHDFNPRLACLEFIFANIQSIREY